jgi:hypothetical protein
MDTQRYIPDAKKYMIDMEGKEVDEWREEEDMVKRKNNWYFL